MLAYNDVVSFIAYQRFEAYNAMKCGEMSDKENAKSYDQCNGMIMLACAMYNMSFNDVFDDVFDFFMALTAEQRFGKQREQINQED